MFKVGERVEIICCKDFPGLVGKKVTVCRNDSKNPFLIRVEFDGGVWQGYYKECQLWKLKNKTNMKGN